MKNVKFELDGSFLTITVDLSKKQGRSKSGKSTVIASTEGNVPIHEGVYIGLNVYETK